MLGETPEFLRSEVMAEGSHDPVWTALEPGEIREDEVVNRRQSGLLYHARQTIAPITDEDGEIEAFVAVQTDITEQVEREQQLAVLERVLRHNLRNDVNIMMSQAELIAEGMTDDPEASAREIIDRGRQLVALADKERNATDLLSEKPEARACDITSVIERTVTSLRTQYADADVSLSLPTGEVTVSTVPAIDQALFELVENAIKHADRETPSVEITVESDGDAVAVRVADEGPPIPETERAIISGETEMDALTHGSGMGLWLTNWIVTRSGGSLSFETNENHGNVVCMVLPLASDPDDGDGVDRE